MRRMVAGVVGAIGLVLGLVAPASAQINIGGQGCKGVTNATVSGGQVPEEVVAERCTFF